MSENDKIIRSFIASVRRHLTVQNMIDMMAVGGAAGFALALALSVLSMLVPFYYAVPVACALAVLCVIAAAVYAFAKKPDMKKSALTIDSLGYKEAVITAYELCGEDGVFAAAVKDEAVRAAAEVRPSRDLPYRPDIRRLVLFAAAAALFAASVYVDTSARQRADRLHEVDKRADVVKDEIEKLESSLDDMKGSLTEPERQEISEICDEAELALESAETADEIRRAVDKLSLKLSDVATADSGAESVLADTASRLAAMSESLGDTDAHTSDKYAEQAGSRGNDGEPNGSSESTEGQSSGGNGQNGNGQQTQGEGQSGTQTGTGEGGKTSNGNDTGAGWNTGSKDRNEQGQAGMEDITIPDGELGNDENLTGQNSGSSVSSYEKSDYSRVWSGSRVTYTDVSSEYRERAYNQVDGSSYPAEMKEKIREYFDGFN